MSILAPLFIILDIGKFGKIQLVYLVGCSSAIIYLVYMFLTMSSRIRQFFFQTKWKYFFGIIVPICGTVGLSYLLGYLSEVFPDLLYNIVTNVLLGSFLIWLIVQLFAFALFTKDLSHNVLDRFEKKGTRRNTLIIFSIIFLTALVIYCVALKQGLEDITKAITTTLFPFPFNLWLLPLIVTIVTGFILLISFIGKKYQSSFFTTFYILIYSLFLLYHVAYLLVYVYDTTGMFVRTINLMTLGIFAFSVFYALQSTGANIKIRLENWWQSVSFFLFAIALFYITWSITFLYDLATYGQVPEVLLEIIFWGVNHLLSYVFGIVLVIITVFIFMKRNRKKG